MAKGKREINFLAPLVIMGVAWAIKKSAEKSQDAVAKKRPANKPKPKHEDLAWKVGLAVALASAEALVTSLMTHTSETNAKESVDETD
ncbi:MAG: hypothetical protein NTW81_05585 [Actinobacteria bacterium]|nr:hypothetical protein [Actinomycetota bacterium]